MSAPIKPWESTTLNNSANIMRSSNPNPAIPQMGTSTTRPALPPRPMQNSYGVGGYGSSYSSPYSSYGGMGGYSSMPYRSSLYGGYGGGYGGYGGYSSYGGLGGYGSSYGGLGGYGSYGGYGAGPYGRDNAEERFVQYVEERSRNTFSNIENLVRAFSSISMMLDNTFFAMTSSFRAVLSVAENFGRLRSVFAQIWYSVSIFRFLKWLHNKLRAMMGLPVSANAKSAAWSEAANGTVAELTEGGQKGSNWSTVAFLGAILAAPYLISKLLPKYEDKCDPEKWKSAGIRAKAAFDFVATSQNELTINTNDEVLLAPKHIQEEMRLYNTGWAFATCNGRSGVVPLNYLVTMKNVNNNKPIPAVSFPAQNIETTQIPESSNKPKSVSFGGTQFIEPEASSNSALIESLDPAAFKAKQEEESKKILVEEKTNLGELVKDGINETVELDDKSKDT
ncbi:peroxisomal membrane protein PEX13 [Onthophagus taurus]|uniref:peroxisomal membrane protein PEX13 n=1 Tax=Onthophagus taurus TaxID=166361 RepID=UPI0039BE0912